MTYKVQSSPKSNVTDELGFESFIVFFNTLTKIDKFCKTYFLHLCDLVIEVLTSFAIITLILKGKSQW